MRKRLEIVILSLVLTCMLLGCHEANYSEEDVVKYVQEMYSRDYELKYSNSKETEFYFYNDKENFGFNVIQKRLNIYFDASVIGSSPVLISDYVKNKYLDSYGDIRDFIDDNGLHVSINDDSAYPTYYMYTSDSTHAEFLGLVFYIKECIGKRGTSYGDIRESVKIHAYYKDSLTEELIDDYNI